MAGGDTGRKRCRSYAPSTGMRRTARKKVVFDPIVALGFTKVPNSLLEALCKVNLSKYEWRVLLFVLRKTHGYHKSSDVIPLSQFSGGTGLDRRHVHRALKSLWVKGMIVKTGRENGIAYAIQPECRRWRLSPVETTVETKEDQAVTSSDGKASPVEMTNPSPPEAPSKEKEIKIKEIKSIKKELEILRTSFNHKVSTYTPLTEDEREKRKAQLREQARQLLQGA